MLHWSPAISTDLHITPIGSQFGARACQAEGRMARSAHARMLAHAAKRRRAALGEDKAYWKACAPAAIAKAAAIRRSADFAPLP